MDYTLLNFNLFDWLLIAIVVYSTLTAFLRGIVLELFALGGLVAGILIAGWNYRHLSAVLGHLLQPLFHVTAGTCNVIAFLVIVLGTMLAASVVAKLVRRTARTIGLGFFDRALGALFGLARGGLLGTALLMAAAAFLPQSTWTANSRLTPYFLAGVHAVSFVVPHELRQQLLNGIAALKHNTPGWIKLHR